MLSEGSSLLLFVASVLTGVVSVYLLSQGLGAGSPKGLEGLGAAEARVALKKAGAARAAQGSRLLGLLALSVVLGAFAGREMYVKDFDPFRELGLESGASPQAVNKAYRSLSLKNHPDRGGDKVVFQRLTRAYHTLTKEADRRNYEKFGNPEGVFEEKFGSMKGTTKAQQGGLMALYLGAFASIIAASYMYISRKRTPEELEATLPAYLRHVRVALRGVDVVEALPGAPTGLPGCPVPCEDDFKAQLLVAPAQGAANAPRAQPVAGPAATKHGLSWGSGKWQRVGEAPEAAEAAAAAAGAAKDAALAGLPDAARGVQGVQEFLDFYEPRFERAARGIPGALPTSMGAAGAPAAEVGAFYAAWRGAAGKIAGSSVDYFDAMKRELKKAMGESAAEEELARDDKVRWGMLQLAYRLDKKKERKAADEARLATLVECAERHDPRLQKKFN